MGYRTAKLILAQKKLATRAVYVMANEFFTMTVAKTGGDVTVKKQTHRLVIHVVLIVKCFMNSAHRIIQNMVSIATQIVTAVVSWKSATMSSWPIKKLLKVSSKNWKNQMSITG